ncbi:quinone oxidoreductase family protein [Nocardia mexicana]|uniref:NADPH:quinone reductase-like Zn-dependent oxidoreductase n=1 Tax=Nocardia mexicana TaxID=279262 RepID=A0A370H083_9NOCA|nr:zinc-binding dehydrogenase [Nocardia mexicana]RDI49325.1 NADPH:quinone reductase-like Zn-dependent oxidoreductase [Nocardia mexicana]
MRKIRFSGGPELVEVPRPEPGAGQLLVRTELVGVHVGLLRTLKSGSGSGLGGEMVGIVVAAGPGVSDGWLGRRVGGVVFDSVYADQVLADPALVTEIPSGANAADALVVVRGGLVALGAVRAGRCAEGESVLVTAAASGSGHLAVQIARALGVARVVGAVGALDKADFVRECGADAVVSYDEPWDERFDVVVDGVGGDLVPRGVEALAPRGRFVAYSAGGGTVAASSLLADLKTVTGFSVGLLARTEPEVLESYRAELWKLLADGRIRPRHVEFAFDRTADALELVETRRNRGRVLLRTGPLTR